MKTPITDALCKVPFEPATFMGVAGVTLAMADLIALREHARSMERKVSELKAVTNGGR